MVLIGETLAYLSLLALSAFLTKKAVDNCSRTSANREIEVVVVGERQPLTVDSNILKSSNDKVNTLQRKKSRSDSEIEFLYDSFSSTEAAKDCCIDFLDEESESAGYEGASESSVAVGCSCNILKRDANEFDDSDEAYYNRQVRYAAYSKVKRDIMNQLNK